jgi:CheY-like chemotaxis protein
MTTAAVSAMYRILIVDDNPAIHQDFRKALDMGRNTDLDATEASIFGGVIDTTEATAPTEEFEIDSAIQGQEALEKVIIATEANRPYAMAFVDMRMPPGWDGLETIQRIWQHDPNIQIVICTAYSDRSWTQIRRQLGSSERWLVMKKPFDVIEVCQLACALTRKWTLEGEASARAAGLQSLILARTAALEDIAGLIGQELRTPLARIGDMASRVAQSLSTIEPPLHESNTILQDIGQTARQTVQVLDSLLNVTQANNAAHPS